MDKERVVEIAQTAIDALKECKANSVLIVVDGRVNPPLRGLGLFGCLNGSPEELAQLVVGVAQYVTSGVRNNGTPEQYQEYMELVGNPITGQGCGCMNRVHSVVTLDDDQPRPDYFYSKKTVH